MANEPTWADVAEEKTPTWEDTIEPSAGELLRPEQRGAFGTRFKPSMKGIAGPPDESLFGITPELVPKGTTPTTSVLSAVGKAGAGLAQFATSPEGIGEIAAAATPAAPVVYAKWAYDLLKGGVMSAKDAVGEVGRLINTAVNNKIIDANQLGVPKDTSQQEHIQKLAEDAVNLTVSLLGGAGAVKGMVKSVPKVTAATFTHPETGETTAAPNHVEAAAAQGVDATGPRESRETKDFGFKVETPSGDAKVVSRDKAEEVAKESGQLIKTPETDKVHSGEIASPTDPTKPLSDVAKPPEPVGLGGALAKGEIDESGTGLKNAVGELERVGTGISEAPETVKRNMAKAWQESGQVESAKPGSGEALAKSLIENPERGLTDADSALLLRHKVDLWNRLNTAAERSHIGDEPSRAAAQAEHKKLLVDYGNLLDAVKLRGAEWGREGRWRQAIVKEDFTFSSTDDLNRYHRTITGQDLPGDKVETAGKIAQEVKEADAESSTKTGEVLQDINTKAPKETTPDPERAKADDQAKAAQNALDAASRTVRNAAKDIADAEVKSRVAKTSDERKLSKMEQKAAARAVAAADKVHREAVRDLAKAQRAMRDDPIKAVWSKVREQIDKGEGNFDDIRNKVAIELGMKVNQVTRIMAQDVKTKRLMDEAWRAQQKARDLRAQAKRWVAGVDTPEAVKALQNIPRGAFGLKTLGHGTVPLGTHAPFVAFQPNYWKTYFQRYGTMYHMVGNKAFYEMQVQDLQRRPNYIVARRNGLVNDPSVYEDYTSPEIAKYIGGGQIGVRGFTVLKILRQDMFDQRWNKLTKSLQTDEMAKAIADGVNHDTGVVRAMAPRGFGTALFAPRLEASRVASLVVDPIRAATTGAKLALSPFSRSGWLRTTPAERNFAVQQVTSKAMIAGTLYGLLVANQGILDAVNSDQKVNLTDPMRSDFLKFKVAGMNFAYGNAMVSMARMPLSLYRVVSADRGRMLHIVYDDENVYTVLGRFTRSQLSPFMGTLVDLGLGSDFESRPLPSKVFGTLEQNRPVPKRLAAEGFEPYSWPEYWSEQASPIPFQEAIKEVWEHGFGMNEEQVKALEKAVAISTIMGATGGRLTVDRDVQ